MTKSNQTKAQKAYDWIISKLDDGLTVRIATQLKCTDIKPKHLKAFEDAGNPLFKIGSDGCLYMARGKSYECIAYKEMILTNITAYSVHKTSF